MGGQNHWMKLGSVLRKPVLGCVALLLSASHTGCTLLTADDSYQCESDSDCKSRGQEWANTVCSPEKICVVAGATGCSTNKKCTEENGGQPSVCLSPGTGSACTPLLTEDCLFVDGDFENDDAIIVGSLAPLTGETAFLGELILPHMRLALSEIETAAVGIPGANGTRRPLVTVSCEEVPQERAEAGVTHLIDTLKVPAIIGPGTSSLMTELALKLTVPAGVLLLSPYASSPALRSLADEGLGWNVTPTSDQEGFTQGKLVPELEKQVRTAQGLAPTDQIKVAVVSRNDPLGQGTTEAMLTTLTFNSGKTATENGDNYLPLQYEPPEDNPSVDFAALVSAIVNEDPPPQIIVLQGLVEIIPSLMLPIEMNWPAAVPKPQYIIASSSISDELFAALGADDDLRIRTRGALQFYDVTSEPYASYALRYKSAFMEDPVFGFEQEYDATYLLAYALATLQNVPAITGKEIATGLTKMKSGLEVNAGPTNDTIQNTFAALAAGGSIDFHGVTGPLDFDQDGVANSNFAVWCVVPDPEEGLTIDLSDTYGVYDPVKGDWVNPNATFTCL